MSEQVTKLTEERIQEISQQPCNFWLDEISSMAHELLLLRKREEWIKVSERLPDMEIPVLLQSCHGWQTVGRRSIFSGDEWYWNNHADFPTESFTHWKPLDAPTKD